MENSIWDHLVELNFALGMLLITIVLIFLIRYCQVTSRLETKQKQIFLSECVNKGQTPSDCALAWKLAKQY